MPDKEKEVQKELYVCSCCNHTEARPFVLTTFPVRCPVCGERMLRVIGGASTNAGT